MELIVNVESFIVHLGSVADLPETSRKRQKEINTNPNLIFFTCGPLCLKHPDMQKGMIPYHCF